MAKAFDPDALITDYYSAWRAANGDNLGVHVEYNRGWFEFWNLGRVIDRVRRADLLEMTARLRRRAEVFT